MKAQDRRLKQMRARRGEGALLARLECLETRISQRPLRFRFFHVKHLPEDYEGELHLVITKVLPPENGYEKFEVEEVPGPGPSLNEQLGHSSRYEYRAIRFVSLARETRPDGSMFARPRVR